MTDLLIITRAEVQQAIDAIDFGDPAQLDIAIATFRAVQEREGPKFHSHHISPIAGVSRTALYTLPETN